MLKAGLTYLAVNANKMSVLAGIGIFAGIWLAETGCVTAVMYAKKIIDTKSSREEILDALQANKGMIVQCRIMVVLAIAILLQLLNLI